MAGVTPVYGFPYPHDTDPVNEGAKHIRDIAQQLESTFDQHGQFPASSELKDLVERLNRFEQMHSEDETISLDLEKGWTEYKNGKKVILTRSGNTVQISGVVTTAKDNDWNGKKTDAIFVVPERHRAKSATDNHSGWIFQGSSTNRWTGGINKAGEFRADRYGPGDPSSNVWMPFVLTYLIGE